MTKTESVHGSAMINFCFIFTDRTAVKIALRSFRDSYYYHNDRLPALKAFLEGKTNEQGDLAVKVSRKLLAV